MGFTVHQAETAIAIAEQHVSDTSAPMKSSAVSCLDTARKLKNDTESTRWTEEERYVLAADWAAESIGYATSVFSIDRDAIRDAIRVAGWTRKNGGYFCKVSK